MLPLWLKPPWLDPLVTRWQWTTGCLPPLAGGESEPGRHFLQTPPLAISPYEEAVANWNAAGWFEDGKGEGAACSFWLVAAMR